MKSRAFITISVLLLFCMSADILACGPWYYRPQDYTLYRASTRYLSTLYPEPTFSIDATENCRLWISDTKTKATIQEVYDIVYKASLEDVQQLNSRKGRWKKLYRKNTFAKTLHKDKDALQFLLLAKLCEKTREEMADPWYYPVKVDPHRTALVDIIKKGLGQLDSPRFWKRYTLQATRAMLTLGQYEECLQLWQVVKDRDWDDCLKVLTIRNVAGAYFNLGEMESAHHLYGSIGDGPSCMMCSNQDLKSIVLSTYQADPNSKYLHDLIEKHIHYEFNSSISLDEYLSEPLKDDLYDICLKIATEGKVKSPDFWFYSAAFISYYEGNLEQALKLVLQAEHSAGSDYIKESAHVLRICIEAESIPYSQSYETAMLEHIKWLDDKIVEHLDEAVDATKLYGIDRMSLNESFYYWNDMLRKVVHGTLAPKLIENHNEVLAIALTNMADNRLLNLVDSVSDVSYSKDYKPIYTTYSMTDYRNNVKLHNDHDYSNSFFCLIDTIDVEKVIQYVNTFDTPNKQQQYLNERSYTDRDYINELIGTRFLREAKYGKAQEWLSKVSPNYQNRLNTLSHMKYDPFTFRKDRIKNKSNYKYSFAKEMARLEKVSTNSTNRDSIAHANAKIAIGMKTSVDYCWPLVYYSWTDDDFWKGANTPYSRSRDYMLEKVEDMYSNALSASDNSEIKAQILLMFGNYKTLMANYSNTETSRSVAGRCDNYYDYHLNKRTTFGEHWIDY